MNERIQRILELVAAGRLGHEDAARLLEALSPKLSVSEEARPHLFGLLGAPDFGPEKVTHFLLLNANMLHPAMPGMPGRPWGRGWGPGPGRGGFPFGLEDLGQRISTAVESALEGSASARGSVGRVGRTLRAQGEDAEGNEFTVNIPLSLAEHADKLLPPLAWKLLERQGMTRDALKLLLGSNPPVGPLIQAEDEEGNEIQLIVMA